MELIHFRKTLFLLLLSSTSLFSLTIGKASWYGEKFHGKKTASGELFNMYGYTASHPSYPFGTMLKVTNLQNKKSINVRVTDRGIYKKGRIIDLSFQAAEDIGMVKSGVIDVSIEKIDSLESSSSELYPIDLDDEALMSKKVAIAYEEDVVAEKPLDEDSVFVTRKSDKEVKKEVKKEKTLSKKSIDKEDIKLQIASFSTKSNAEEFLKNEKSEYRLEIEPVYIKHLEKTLYKVVILCDSSSMVQDIRDSKKYKGAYVLSKNVD